MLVLCTRSYYHSRSEFRGCEIFVVFTGEVRPQILNMQNVTMHADTSEYKRSEQNGEPTLI